MDKMDANSQTTFSDAFLLMTSFGFLFEFHLKLLSMVQWKKSAEVQVVVWRRTGDKSLYQPMLTQFTDAYMRPRGEMIFKHIRDKPNP